MKKQNLGGTEKSGTQPFRMFSVEYGAFAHSIGKKKNRHVESLEFLWILNRSLVETGKKQVLYFLLCGEFYCENCG